MKPVIEVGGGGGTTIGLFIYVSNFCGSGKIRPDKLGIVPVKRVGAGSGALPPHGTLLDPCVIKPVDILDAINFSSLQ